MEWKQEVDGWNALKGKARGKRLLLGEKKTTPRLVQPPTNVAEDSEVSFTVPDDDQVRSDRNTAGHLRGGKRRGGMRGLTAGDLEERCWDW